jgi:hypothetical protein
MTLFVLLLALAQDVDCHSCETISGMASALTDNDSARFMQFIDPAAPNRSALRTDVEALIAQNQISCSIEVLEEKASDDTIDALTDWYMVIRPNQDGASTERRRMRVHVMESKGKRGWRVVEFTPRSILAPVLLAP